MKPCSMWCIVLLSQSTDYCQLRAAAAKVVLIMITTVCLQAASGIGSPPKCRALHHAICMHASGSAQHATNSLLLVTAKLSQGRCVSACALLLIFLEGLRNSCPTEINRDFLGLPRTCKQAVSANYLP